MPYIAPVADPTWMLIGDDHVNLARAKFVRWTYKTPADPTYDDGRPVRAAVLHFEDATVEVTDPRQAHMVWLWFCAHEVPLSRKETAQ